MNKLAELIDKKTRVAARADYPAAILEASAKQKFIGRTEFLDIVSNISEEYRAKNIPGAKAIRLIMFAVKGLNRFTNLEKPKGFK